MKSKMVLIISLLVVIISAPAVYFLVLLIDKILLLHYDFIISEGSKDAWIGFAGSIIGGLMTMLALYFTIKREEKKAENDKIKEIRPFIICKPNFDEDFLAGYSQEGDNCIYTISLDVENVSNNLVKDLTLESEIVYEFNPETEKYDLENQELLRDNRTYYSIYTVLLDTREMIKSHDIFSFKTNFLIDNYSKAQEKSHTCFKVIATYKYRDVLDIVEYTHRLEYELFINYTNTGEYKLFSQSVQNKLISEEKIKQ